MKKEYPIITEDGATNITFRIPNKILTEWNAFCNEKEVGRTACLVQMLTHVGILKTKKEGK